MHHLSFHMVIAVFCLFLIGETIVNIYYYNSLYNNGGTPHIGKTSSGIMFAFNILALVLEVCVFVWAVLNIFSGTGHLGSKKEAAWI